MTKEIIKKNNWRTNNDLMARGLLELLRSGNGEPYINKREISRRSGVPYIVVKEHCKRGFVTGNMQRVAAELGEATDGGGSSRLMAARLTSCIKKNAIWFAIEDAGKMCYLRKAMADSMRESVTAGWSEQAPAKRNELYLLFCYKFYRIVQGWIDEGCPDETAVRCEIRLSVLLEACASSQVNAAVFC